MAYYTRFVGQLGISPPAKPSDAADVNGRFCGWRISPNGTILYWPSDALDEGGLEVIEQVVRDLSALGYTVVGSATWTGEDGVTGTVRVEGSNVSITEDPEEPLSGAETQRLLADIRTGGTEPFLRALEALQYFRVGSSELVDAIVGRLGDADLKVRIAAAASLGEFADQTRPAVPALVAALEDEHPWVRSAAAESLGQMGALASSALQALSALRNDENYGPRGKASEAIERITGSKTAG